MQFAVFLGTWTAGSGKLAVSASAFGTGGEGLCVMITGGEKAHVGGTAYAVPRMRSNGTDLTADISTICASGHKDVYAAASAAKQISITLNEPVCVTAGIHVEHISEEEMAELNRNIEEAVAALAAACRSELNK